MIPGLSALRVHNAFLYLAGIATALAAYAYNFQTCAIYAAFCGFMIGKREREREKNKTITILF